MDSQLKIRKWDPSTILPGAVILIVGKRRTGKSLICMDIMYHLKDRFDYGIAFCPTEESSKTLCQYIPETCIFPDYRDDKIEALMQIQKRHWSRPEGGKEVFILLDDCLYDKTILRSKVMREITMNGRHRHITLILVSQYLNDLPSNVRSQFDYVIATRENIYANKEKLYRQFFGFFKCPQDFSVTMDTITLDYGAVVFDGQNPQSTKVEDNCFWFRATQRESFRCVPDSVFNLSEKCYKDPEEYIEGLDEARSLPPIIKIDTTGKPVI